MAKKVVKKVAKPAKKAAKPVAKKAAKPAPKKANKSTPKKVAKPVAKKAAKPAPKKVVKVVAKKAAKPAPKKVVKPAAKKVVKPVAKKAAKPAPKKVAKPVAKKVVKPAAKKAAKPVKKEIAKPAPKAAVKVTKAVAKVVEPVKVKTPALPQKDMEIKKAPVRERHSLNSSIIHRPIDKKMLDLNPNALPTNKVVEPARGMKHENKDKRARYSDEELQEFKEIIIKKLDEARKDYDILKDTLSHRDDHGTDDTSPTFKLLEDGSDVLSKEETAQLAARQQKFIENLENALIRIENKTYGICRVTGNLISKERLRSVPHATLSIEAKLDQNTGH